VQSWWKDLSQENFASALCFGVMALSTGSTKQLDGGKYDARFISSTACVSYKLSSVELWKAMLRHTCSARARDGFQMGVFFATKNKYTIFRKKQKLGWAKNSLIMIF